MIAALQLTVAQGFLQDAANAGQAIAGFTSLVLVISVPLLVRQVRLQARASRVELITGMTALISEVGKAFIDHPEMRRYFYENRRPPPWHHARASAIAVALASVIDHVVVHFDALDAPAQAAWNRYFGYIYGHSPVLREHLAPRWEWYAPKLRSHLDPACRDA